MTDIDFISKEEERLCKKYGVLDIDGVLRYQSDILNSLKGQKESQ